VEVNLRILLQKLAHQSGFVSRQIVRDDVNLLVPGAQLDDFLPIVSGKTKIPGIKIPDTRIIRLMEVLLNAGIQLNGWRTAQIHQAILTAFALSPDTYGLTQIRYDLRKLRAHSLLERDG
jgi:hypothetical protein